MRGKKVAVLLGIVLLFVALGCNLSRPGDKIDSCPTQIRDEVSDFKADVAPFLDKYVSHEKLGAVESAELESQLRSSWRVGKCQLHVDCSYSDEMPEGMETQMGKKLAKSNPVCAEGLRDFFRNVKVKLDVLKFRNLHQSEKAPPSSLPVSHKVKKIMPVGGKTSR